MADFGLSKIKRNTLVTGGVRGTLPWMAPELLNGGSNKVSEKVSFQFLFFILTSSHVNVKLSLFQTSFFTSCGV